MIVTICNCCGANTTPTESRRDEDGWYYCTTCVVVAEIEEEKCG